MINNYEYYRKQLLVHNNKTVLSDLKKDMKAEKERIKDCFENKIEFDNLYLKQLQLLLDSFDIKN